MAPFNNCIEEIAFLTRSPTRVRILQELHRDGPVDTYALRRRFDCDRTTLQRNLDALVDHGWVQRTNNTYQITRMGTLLFEGLAECLDTAGTAIDLKPFLQWMPDDTFDFDPALLADADIITSSPSNPDRVICKHTGTLRTADQFRGFIPFIGRRSLETVWRRVTNDEGQWEVVVPAESVDSLQADSEYAAMFDDLLASDHIDVLVTDTEIAYYLGIIDDTVQIGNRTDDGMRRAMLETEQNAVRAWAIDTYEEYKQQASIL